MADKVKTYEEFAGTKEYNTEKVKAYTEYVREEVAKANPQPAQKSDIWPVPKNK